MRPFTLSAEALNPAGIRAALQGPASGAYVSFEGWVRNHNEGKAVLRLEYEAYAKLAEAEGARIIAEAHERFPLDAAACVHRVGALEIGGIAVVVGVASAHRGEAFAACRYIIDEVKHRVPIWKKEHYADGDSGWVNCEACAAGAHGHAHGHGAPPTLTAPQYYARQMILPEIGEAGQAALGAARVLVVGAGGLGCAAIPYLAAAGVGVMGVCDGERVEASNLHRQILFRAGDVGQPKAALAADFARTRNPFIEVRAHEGFLGEDNAESILADYDYVLDCTDNFAAKYLLNDACVALGKVLIQASIYQHEGQIFVVRPEPDAPCLRCLWPEALEAGCIQNCAEAGVLGTVAGALGVLQAQETLKEIVGLSGALRGEVLYVDLLSYGTRRVKARRAARCGAHNLGIARPAQRPGANVHSSPVDVDNVDGCEVIDLREDAERGASPLPWASRALPISAFEGGVGPLKRDGRYVLVCAQGMRSRYVAMHLRSLGIAGAYSLRRGAAGLRRG